MFQARWLYYIPDTQSTKCNPSVNHARIISYCNENSCRLYCFTKKSIIFARHSECVSSPFQVRDILLYCCCGGLHITLLLTRTSYYDIIRVIHEYSYSYDNAPRDTPRESSQAISALSDPAVPEKKKQSSPQQRPQTLGILKWHVRQRTY